MQAVSVCVHALNSDGSPLMLSRILSNQLKCFVNHVSPSCSYYDVVRQHSVSKSYVHAAHAASAGSLVHTVWRTAVLSSNGPEQTGLLIMARGAGCSTGSSAGATAQQDGGTATPLGSTGVIGPAQIGMSCAGACQQLRQLCCHFSAAWLIACESKYDTSGTCCAVVARVCVQALAAVEYPPGEAWGEDLLLALRPQLPSMEPHELIALMAALATLEVRGHSAMGVGCVWWGGVGGREHGVAAVLSLAPPHELLLLMAALAALEGDMCTDKRTGKYQGARIWLLFMSCHAQ